MLSNKQKQDFIDWVIPQGLLHDAIIWIRNSMKPEDVFDSAELSVWAIENDFIKVHDK